MVSKHIDNILAVIDAALAAETEGAEIVWRDDAPLFEAVGLVYVTV